MARRRRRAVAEQHANNERWLLTYADMITLLMVLFIVLFAISQVDNKKFDALHEGLARSFGADQVLDGSQGLLDGSQKQAITPDQAPGVSRPAGETQAVASAPPDPLAQLQQQLTAALRAHGLTQAVQFQRQTRGLVINIVTDKVLFDLGSAQLRPHGADVLDAVLPALAKLPNQLTVEGHTDDLPIHGGRYPSNWELSAERATTVLRYLIQHGIAARRLSAAGYADQRPLVPNDNPADRARNRRVAIVVLSSDPAGTAPSTSAS